jgi:hypothetical protein
MHDYYDRCDSPHWGRWAIVVGACLVPIGFVGYSVYNIVDIIRHPPAIEHVEQDTTPRTWRQKWVVEHGNLVEIIQVQGHAPGALAPPYMVFIAKSVKDGERIMVCQLDYIPVVVGDRWEVDGNEDWKTMNDMIRLR